MNWTMLLIGFSLAVLMGAGCATVVAQMRPHWTPRRRGFVAAAVLPAITLVATVAGLLWIASLEYPGGGDMRDLAVRTIGLLGLGFVCVAFVGGLIGAALAQRRR